MSGAAAGDLSTHSGIVVPSSALFWRFSRSSGPGGQHVNTSDTRVELLCDLTQATGAPHVLDLVRERLGDEVRIVAANSRSQAANREEALRRLAVRIEAASRFHPPRKKTRPHRGAVEARLEDKRQRGRRKAERRRPTEE